MEAVVDVAEDGEDAAVAEEEDAAAATSASAATEREATVRCMLSYSEKHAIAIPLPFRALICL